MFSKNSTKKLRIGKPKLSLLFVVILLVYFTGCSITKHHKILSVFFDGVPEPSKEIAKGKTDTLKHKDTVALANNAIKNIPKGSVHPPYQEKQCDMCHDKEKIGSFTQEIPSLCYQCHADFAAKYKVLHGPVGGGQCLQCHNPHSSPNAKLVTRTGQSLCLKCHDKEQVMKVDVHNGINETNCTECHNPHGGEDRYVLR